MKLKSQPVYTKEYVRMASVAKKNLDKKRSNHVKIKFVLAIFVFCFLASCFAAAISHYSILHSALIEAFILLSLIFSYFCLKKNIKSGYKKAPSIVLTILDIISIFVSACELYYFTSITN